MDFILVGLGGFLGAIARYLIYLFQASISQFRFPAGTLFINVAGSFFAGLLFALVEKGVPLNRHVVLLASMGFLGSFTTFSTFGMETYQLLRLDQMTSAFINVIANVAFGLGAIWLGRYLVLKF